MTGPRATQGDSLFTAHKNGRLLEIITDADGGALIVQENDPARQSVFLTGSELRWLAFRLPLQIVKSWWLRDDGGSDTFDWWMRRAD